MLLLIILRCFFLQDSTHHFQQIFANNVQLIKPSTLRSDFMKNLERLAQEEVPSVVLQIRMCTQCVHNKSVQTVLVHIQCILT